MKIKELEQRQQEACMDEQEPPDKTQIWKGSIQEAEGGADDPGEIQRHCLNMQGRGLGKPKLIWSWIWQWMLRTMRRALHRYISRKKDSGKHEPVAERGRVFGDKVHTEGCGAHCHLHLSLYWEDLLSGIPDPPEQWKSLVQGSPTLGGGGSH